MSPEEEFDVRINAIYRLCETTLEQQHTVDAPLDMRRAEFQAMADAFLGGDYDREKLKKVEGYQAYLREQQASLYQRYKKKKLTAEEYVDAYNSLLADTFFLCEEVLGTEDFLKLFGAPRRELGGFIDKDTFVATERE